MSLTESEKTDSGTILGQDMQSKSREGEPGIWRAAGEKAEETLPVDLSREGNEENGQSGQTARGPAQPGLMMGSPRRGRSTASDRFRRSQTGSIKGKYLTEECLSQGQRCSGNRSGSSRSVLADRSDGRKRISRLGVAHPGRKSDQFRKKTEQSAVQCSFLFQTAFGELSRRSR